MTEDEWRTTTDVLGLLLSLRKRQKRDGSDPERFRTFALACIGRIRTFLGEDLKRMVGEIDRGPQAREAILGPLLTAVEGVGQRASAALEVSRGGAGDVRIVADRFAELLAAEALWITAVSKPFGAARGTQFRAAQVAWWVEVAGNVPPDFGERPAVIWSDRFPESVTELAAQAELLRCIFGNPFRPVAFDPSWRTEAVVGLARGMDEGRDFATLPVLADALEDAGCADAELLAHCRGPGPHARGCHAVDHVLGRW